MKSFFARIFAVVSALVFVTGAVSLTPILQECALHVQAADEVISSLLITGVTSPYAGTIPVTTGITTDEPDKINVDNVVWADAETAKSVRADEPFEEGKQYRVKIYLTPKAGYAFPMDDLDSMYVQINRRADDAYAESIVRVRGTSSQICVNYCFTSVKKPVEVVTDVMIKNVQSPYAGTNPVKTGVTVDEPDKITVVNVGWWDVEADAWVKDTDKFELGNEYQAIIYLEPKDGYAFPMDDLDSMHVHVNRLADDAWASEITAVYGSDTKIAVTYNFTSVAKPVEVITDVLIQNVQSPYAGTNPVKDGVTVDEPDKITVASVGWWDISGRKWMNVTDKFKLGNEYQAIIYLEPKDGYAFPMNNLDLMNVHVNRLADDAWASEITAVYGSDTKIAVTYNFTSVAKPVEVITDVLIQNVQSPYAGTNPVKDGVTVDEPDKITVADVGWWDIEADAWVKDTDKFELGKEYRVIVYLEPKEGYAFPMEDLDSMHVHVNRLSDDAWAYEILGVYDSESQIAVEYEFTSVAKPAEMVTDVLIENVQPPYAGTNPVETGVTVDEPDKITVADVGWWDISGRKWMNVTDKFKLGNEYQAIVYLEPKDGYAFPMDDLDSMHVHVNRLADDAWASEITAVYGSDTKIAVTYNFTSVAKPVEVITDVLIQNVQSPYTGTNPVKDGVTVDEPDKITVADVGWWDMTGRKWMDTTDVFQLGREYRVIVYLEPKEGYAFPMNDLGSMNVHVNRRADDAWAYDIAMVDGSDTQIAVEYEFTSYEKPVEVITDVMIRNVQSPYADTNPVQDGVTVDEPDKITVVRVDWWDLHASKRMQSTDKFILGEQYRVIVYLEPKEGYAFPLEDLDSMNVHVNRLADDAWAYEVLRVHNSDAEIAVYYEFTSLEKPLEMITNVMIQNVQTPYADTHPVETGVTVNKPDQVIVESVKWVDAETREVLEAEDSFVGMREYAVQIILKPAEGYAFPVNNLDSMTIHVGRLADECIVNEVYKADGSDEKICIYYYFLSLEKGIMRGDVDDNGEVTAADAQMTLKAFAEIIAENPHGLSSEQFAAADVDHDGELTAKDAQTILAYFLYNTVLDTPTDWEDLL